MNAILYCQNNFQIYQFILLQKDETYAIYLRIYLRVIYLAVVHSRNTEGKRLGKAQRRTHVNTEFLLRFPV